MSAVLCAAVIIVANAFIWFHVGKWEERKRARRQLSGQALSVHADMIVQRFAEQVQFDTAEMMREMEFYGECAERCTARGGNA